MKAVKLSAFLGIDNRRPMQDRRTEDGTFLWDAVNVDVEEGGTLRRRRAADLVLSVPNAHSGFAWGGRFYVASNRVLLENGEKPLCSVKGTVSVAGLGKRLYFSDGETIRVLEGGKVSPITLPTPDAPSGSAPGANRHLVALTAFFGELEGPPSEMMGFGAGTIRLPNVSGADAIGVYVSGDGGETLNLLLKAENGAEVRIAKASGKTLSTAGFGALPAGIIRFSNGRLFSAVGCALFWSEPYNFGMTNPVANYALFPEPISLIEPCGSGLWVVSDHAYFLSQPGSPESALTDALPYGAVSGASSVSKNGEEVWWLSRRGIVRGGADGRAENVSEEHWLAEFSGSGALLATSERVVGCCDGA